MPRSASRILLEITDIRVERLNDISKSDAIRELNDDQTKIQPCRLPPGEKSPRRAYGAGREQASEGAGQDYQGEVMSERVIILIGPAVASNAIMVIRNLPVDGSMEIAIRPRKKLRTNQQNHLWWGYRLKEISEQVWVNGKQFSADVWHEHMKREYLPEGNEADFDKLVTKGYVKWAWLPNGERDCIGSTTKLTTLGMTRYMEACEAYCATELGVRFSAEAAQCGRNPY